MPTPAIASTKVKSVTKSTAVTAASRGSTAAVKTFARVLDDESSEESDSDDEVQLLVPSMLECFPAWMSFSGLKWMLLMVEVRPLRPL